MDSELILTIHGMAKSIEENNSVHAAVLDFSKAFDKVPHKRLIHKLHYYGIRGPLSSWIDKPLTVCGVRGQALQSRPGNLWRAPRNRIRTFAIPIVRQRPT